MEVWGDRGEIVARRLWNEARTAWLAERGLDVAEGCRVLPPRRPWRLSDDGAEARLERYGVTRHEVDARCCRGNAIR